MIELMVVIPTRDPSSVSFYRTLESLKAQSWQDFAVCVVHDRELRGANWARNRGAELTRSPLILFCDDDIVWKPNAFENLRGALAHFPAAAYSYGAYWMPTIGTQCDAPFDAARLRRSNYISTMSMIWRDRFPGFDESIERLQDWDLWLTMLKNHDEGIFCGHLVFETKMREGITYGAGSISHEEARRIVAAKHGL